MLGQEPSFWILYTALEPGIRSHGVIRVSRSGEVSPRIPIPGLQHEPTLATAIRGPGGESVLVIAEPTFVQGIDESFGGIEHVALSLVACVDGLAFVDGQSSVKSVPIGTNDTLFFGQMVACGDPNGDGIQDIAVSQPHEGTTRLLSGSDLSLLRTLESPSDWFSDCGGFGRAQALIPDCDADGIDDLVVGNMEWAGESPEGAMWHMGAFHVYSLASGSLIDSVYGADTTGLGSGFAAFRHDDGVFLITVASRKLLGYRIAMP